MEHLFQRASNNGNGNADQIGQYVVRTVNDKRELTDSIRQHYKRMKQPIPQFTTRVAPQDRKGQKRLHQRPFRVWRG